MLAEKVKKIGFFILFSFIFVFFSQSVAQAISYETLGGRPAYPDPNIKNSSSWFIYNLSPGETKEDGVLVVNNSNKIKTVFIYPADGVVGSSGGFALKQLADKQTEVGTWLTLYPNNPPDFFIDIFQKKKENKITYLCQTSIADLEKDMQEYGFLEKKKHINQNQQELLKEWCKGNKLVKLKLKPQERVIVPFIFKVPQNVDVGEHIGGILIQKVDDNKNINVGGSAVKLTIRIGVRIYETVPGKVVKKLKLEKFSVKKNFKEFDLSRYFFAYWIGKGNPKPEEYIVSSTIKNEGNVSIEHQDIIHIQNLIFKTKKENIERQFQVLRGSKFDSNYGWHNPRFGWYSFQKEIKYKDSNNQVHTLFTDKIKIWIIPWREIVLAIIILIIVYLGYKIWKYRQKKKYGGEGWIKYEIKEGDNINNLAEKYQIKWKVLAKTNKLKPPYTLKTGQTILVPSLNKEEAEKNNNTENEDNVITENNLEKKNKKEKIKLFFQNNKWWIIIIIFILIGIVFIYYLNKNNKAEIKKEISISSVGGEIINNNTEKKEQYINQEIKNISVNEKEKNNFKKVEIVVLNGGAVPGSAGKMKNILKEYGYENVEAKNALNKNYANITLYYSDDKNEELANLIKKEIVEKYSKKKIIVKKANNQEERQKEIVIIIGQDK